MQPGTQSKRLLGPHEVWVFSEADYCTGRAGEQAMEQPIIGKSARIQRALGIALVTAFTASTAMLIAGIAIAARRPRVKEPPVSRSSIDDVGVCA